MKYAKIEDGVVVQTQRRWQAGFSEVPEHIVPGYLYTGGEFSVPGRTKAQALSMKLAEIDKAVTDYIGVTFPFAGRNFYIDVETIQGVYSVLPLLPDDYVEHWKTADLEPDGVTNIYVDLGKAQIRGMALALLTHKKTAWALGDSKKQELKVLVANPQTTATDIENFDTSIE